MAPCLFAQGELKQFLDTPVEVKVFDSDVMGNEEIGCVSVSLDLFRDRKKNVVEFVEESIVHSNGGEPKGQVDFKVRLRPWEAVTSRAVTPGEGGRGRFGRRS